MSNCDRELAKDCWQALALLRHPAAGDIETPEWLATASGYLRPVELPGISERVTAL